MDKQDILRMAREAGFEDGWVEICNVFEELTNLVNIVAAAAKAEEREACAQLCEDSAWRLKKVAVENNSASTNSRAIQASHDADAIRARQSL